MNDSLVYCKYLGDTRLTGEESAAMDRERKDKSQTAKSIGYLDESSEKRAECVVPLFLDPLTGDPSASPAAATITGLFS